MRLESLRKAEATAKLEADSAQDDDPATPRCLHDDVAWHEHQLAKSIRDQEDLQRILWHKGILFEGIKHWAQQIARYFAPFEELCQVGCQADIAPFFSSLVRTLEKLMDRAHMELAASQCLSLSSQ